MKEKVFSLKVITLDETLNDSLMLNIRGGKNESCQCKGGELFSCQCVTENSKTVVIITPPDQGGGSPLIQA